MSAPDPSPASPASASASASAIPAEMAAWLRRLAERQRLRAQTAAAAAAGEKVRADRARLAAEQDQRQVLRGLISDVLRERAAAGLGRPDAAELEREVRERYALRAAMHSDTPRKGARSELPRGSVTLRTGSPQQGH